MSDRKNIKIDEETYDRLRELRGEYETWNGFFHRVADEIDSD